VKHLRAKQIPNLVVVAPDPGGLKMAYAYSNMLEAGLAIVAKQRHSATEVEALNLVGDVKGCNAVLVDDLCTTGGTLYAAAKLLKERGTQRIFAAVTHAVLTEQAIERLKDSPIESMVTTNSVPAKDWRGFPVEVLSVADLLGEAILRIHSNQSVTSLFNV
jgi:ribose-phosphate pyrophosphokinase